MRSCTSSQLDLRMRSEWSTWELQQQQPYPSDVQTPSLQRILGLSAVHDRVHTNRRLHLQTALVYFGWLRQTANKKRQILHRYENRLLLSTENFRCKLSSVS